MGAISTGESLQNDPSYARYDLTACVSVLHKIESNLNNIVLSMTVRVGTPVETLQKLVKYFLY